MKFESAQRKISIINNGFIAIYIGYILKLNSLLIFSI